MKNKKCFKCGVNKSIHLFYKHPQMTDGHVNKCKSCNKKDVQNNYRKNIEHYREYERIRFKDSDRKAKLATYQIKRRIKYKGKNLARQKVSNSIRNGKLIRQPCVVCGNIKSEAHHSDYRKPLCITWLCFKHHREAHKQNVK